MKQLNFPPMRLDFFCYFTNTFGQQRGCRKRQCVEPFLKRTGTFSSTMFLSYAPTYQKKQNKENQMTSLRPVSWPSSLSLCRWRPSDEKMATVLGEVPSCQGGDATPRSLVSQRGEKKNHTILYHLSPYSPPSHDFIQMKKQAGNTDCPPRVLRF